MFFLLKWLHVLAAIVAVGANVTYGIWSARASRNPGVLLFVLHGIKRIDDRIANPAYGALLLTGLLMVLVVQFSLTTPWLLTALGFYLPIVLIGLFGYTPTLRRQIQVLDQEGFSSPAYQAVARRGTILGVLLVDLAVIIVFLMVVKPTLWA